VKTSLHARLGDERSGEREPLPLGPAAGLGSSCPLSARDGVHAVRTFALDRITASCGDDNQASWQLMERIVMHTDRRSDGERPYSLDLDLPCPSDTVW
jgi:hypothetical protein